MTFKVIFADDKRKAVLIRGLETPFWNAERKVRFDTCLSQKHVSVEMVNVKLFWNAFISPTDYVKALCLRNKLRNAAVQWQGLPLDSYSRYWEIDDKRNNSKKAFRKAFAYAFWFWVLKRVSTLGKELLGKMINAALKRSIPAWPHPVEAKQSLETFPSCWIQLGN